MWYRDSKYWIIMDIEGTPLDVFNIQEDPNCQNNLVSIVSGDIIAMAWERILEDAGDELPDYRSLKQTDAIGGKK